MLAEAIVAHLTTGHDTAPQAYSARSLARVCRAPHVSWWMTMLHREPAQYSYGEQLVLAQLRDVVASRARPTVLAENYDGVPSRRARAREVVHG